MGIRLKIILSMLLLALLFLPMNFYLFKQYLEVRRNFLTIVDQTVPRLEALLNMQSLTMQINLFINNFNKQFEETSGNPNTPNKIAAAKDKFLSILEELGEQQTIYNKYMQKKSERLNQLRDEVVIIALDIFSAKERGFSESIVQSKIKLLEKNEEQLNEFIKALLLQESTLLDEEKERSLQGAKNLRNALLFLNALVILIALLLSLFLMRVISKPISELSHFASHIDYENLQPLLPILSEDEIGQLQTHLNLMVIKLNKTKTTLIETSRAAGIAEIATGILHNVGNVLNSMKTAISLIQENMRGQSIEQLNKVLQMLEDNQNNLDDFIQNNEKGKLLFPYFKMLMEQMQQDNKKMQEELNTLTKNLILVNQIINVQQNSIQVGVSLAENIEIEEIIEDILVLYANRLRRGEITIERKYSPIPVFSSVKNRLQQILINLIKNAIDALTNRTGEKRLIICTKLDNTQKNIVIMISDNGVGITQEDLPKIFSFGFTTKKDGYGYGLHNCALLAKELGGNIHCRSKGVEQGTTFILKIPL